MRHVHRRNALRFVAAAVTGAMLAASLTACADPLGPGAKAQGTGVGTPPGPWVGPLAAPYYFLDANGPLPPPVNVMKATGIRRFTLAFIVSSRSCNPAWAGTTTLANGTAEAAIRDIRAAGGDVAASFGGMGNGKLAVACKSPEALASAYQKVISTFRLRSIDLDAEDAEITSAAARDRIVSALGIVRRQESGLTISVTIPSTPDGPDHNGQDLINRAAAAGLQVNAWTILPFDFGTPVPSVGEASVSAAEGLKADLMSAYHESASAAYHTMGISSMNGKTDTGEIVRESDFQAIVRYARAHHRA